MTYADAMLARSFTPNRLFDNRYVTDYRNFIRKFFVGNILGESIRITRSPSD
jgi:hypothetical protein